MTRISSALLLAALLFAVPCLHGQASPASISGEVGKLRSLPAQERPAATIKAANEIGALPPGMDKVELADKVSQRVTEGDQGHNGLQAAPDALSKALAATPFRSRGGEVPQPSMDLARLARCKHVAVS